MLRSAFRSLALAWAKRPFLRPPSLPRIYATTGYETVDHEIKLEEENWRHYSPEAFYPASIGEVLNTRYQILGKLGYGGHSTAWLCRDLRYAPRSRHIHSGL